MINAGQDFMQEDPVIGVGGNGLLVKLELVLGWRLMTDPGLAMMLVPKVHENSEQPGFTVGLGLELIESFPGAQHGFLHQVLGRFLPLTQPQRRAPQRARVRHGFLLKTSTAVAALTDKASESGPTRQGAVRSDVYSWNSITTKAEISSRRRLNFRRREGPPRPPIASTPS